MNLTQKRILVVAPKYFGYEEVLMEELRNMGAQVQYLENKPFQYDPLNRGTGKLTQLLCRKKRYITKTLIPASDRSFDFCIFINLFSFDPAIINKLKKVNPDIRCILYLWDNIKGYKWESFFPCFDKICSFDPVESIQFNLKYLPNFYSKALPSNQPIQFDVSFIGSFQVDRLRMLEQLALTAKRNNKTFYFFLHLSTQYSSLKYNRLTFLISKLLPDRFLGFRKLYRLIAQRDRHEFVHSTPHPLNETLRILAASKAIIDLPYESQTGSTQRLTLGLGLSKKIFTTNRSVVHDSFYNPDYIRVISPPDLELDWEWIEGQPGKNKVIESLRIDNWIDTLLC